jgi:glutathione S-transferase
MTQFTVHSIPGSPFGRTVFAALEEKGAPYRLAPMRLDQVRGPAHLALHAFGRIPVLDHDGFVLYETQAILRYLDRILPSPALTPAAPQAAARMDQLLNISDWYLFQGVSNVIGFQRVVAPRLLGRAPDEAAIAAALPRAELVITELSRLLGDQIFFAGAELSLADLMLISQLDFLAQTPEWATLTKSAPNLAPWLERMNARPSVKATTWDRIEDMAKAA